MPRKDVQINRNWKCQLWGLVSMWKLLMLNFIIGWVYQLWHGHVFRYIKVTINILYVVLSMYFAKIGPFVHL
jgi:hypothetical protein